MPSFGPLGVGVGVAVWVAVVVFVCVGVGVTVGVAVGDDPLPVAVFTGFAVSVVSGIVASALGGPSVDDGFGDTAAADIISRRMTTPETIFRNGILGALLSKIRLRTGLMRRRPAIIQRMLPIQPPTPLNPVIPAQKHATTRSRRIQTPVLRMLLGT
jgi:hypothetical protein